MWGLVCWLIGRELVLFEVLVVRLGLVMLWVVGLVQWSVVVKVMETEREMAWVRG